MFFTDAYRALRRGELMLALRYLLISILVIAVVALPAGFYMLRRFERDATYHFMTKERGVAPHELVLYGQSLGTAAAIDLASRRECGALVAESGLSSPADMAGAGMPWLPRLVRGLTKN